VAKKPGTKAQARRGLRGAKGRPGAPGIAPGALRAIIADMEQMYADAGIQFKRIAQLQAQLDMTVLRQYSIRPKNDGSLAPD
jgi:hypothetical protein